MKKSLSILLLLICCSAFSQESIATEIVGIWKVTKVNLSNDSPNLKDLLKGFGSATFTFKKDGMFSLTTTVPTALFDMFNEKSKSAGWKWNNSKQYLMIGSQKDGYTIMKIIVIESNGKTIFHLSETEIDLEVQKQ